MQRAERTIDILFRAFFKGRLFHGNSCNCAVGNLVRAGGCFPKEWVCLIPVFAHARHLHPQIVFDNAEMELASTEYMNEEIFRIEAAFELRQRAGCLLGQDNDPDSFLGLSAVFDCMIRDVDQEYFASRPAFKITNQVELIEEMV